MFDPRQPRGASWNPVPWTTYFERELFLTAAEDPSVTFHTYLISPVGTGPLFVLHHGAGSSGASFAVLSSEIRKRLPSAGILALDARGHGGTRLHGPASSRPDLRLETLSRDLRLVVALTKAEMKWSSLPSVILVGHSLGGAVVADVACQAAASGTTGGDLDAALLGYAVLDVVEGSAVEALGSMSAYLSTRPRGFRSLPAAIEWHVRSRTVRNATSARVSVPALLLPPGTTAEGPPVATEPAAALLNPTGQGEPGREHGMVEEDILPWHWRTNLLDSQPYWEGWFSGLSKKFLSGRGGKLLLLAGTDRLDTELTIGQMQGEERRILNPRMRSELT